MLVKWLILYYSLQYNWHRDEKADLIPAGGEKLRGKGRKTPRYFPHTIPTYYPVAEWEIRS